MNFIDRIVERRVSEAREEGRFANLALKGRPIPDIDRRREEGWWANQAVARARAEYREEQGRLEAEVDGLPADEPDGNEPDVSG
jgi:hypothetical protein